MPFLSSWRIAKWYDRREAKRNAQRDKPLIFSKSKEPPFYWKEVAKRGSMKVSGLTTGWLGHKIHRLYETALATLENSLVRLKKATIQRAEAVDYYVEQISNNPPPILKKPWYYLPLFIAIFVFDVAFNAVVFRIFGEPEFHTYLFTFGFVVALAVCAHIAGILSHQPDKPENRVIVTLTTTVPLLLFVGIGLVRLYYLRSMYQEEGGADSELTPIIDSNSFLLVFIAINLVMFVGAVVLSYSCHDPIRDQLVEARYQYDSLFEKALRAIEWFKKVFSVWELEKGKYLSGAHWYSHECGELMDIHGKEYERFLGDHGITWPKRPNVVVPQALTDSKVSGGLSPEASEMLKQLLNDGHVKLPEELQAALMEPKVDHQLLSEPTSAQPKEVTV